MARVLLLIPSRTYRAHDFMEAAMLLGVEVIVGTEHRPALAAMMQERHLQLSFNDVPLSTERIRGYAAEHPLDAIVSVDDAALLLAASASETLGLSYNSRESVAATRDKLRMRQRFQAAGLLTPRFRAASIDDGPEDLERGIDYPAVVKPLHLSASQGVIKVDTPSEFPAVFRRVAAIVRSCAPPSPSTAGQRGDILIEDFIPGTEVAVEGLLRHGALEVLAIFDKPDPLNGPYFEETIYVTPSRLPQDVQSKVNQATQAGIRALGLTEGPIHAELRINDAGVWVLEIAARSIGGLCSRTLRFGSGISLEDLILRHAAKLPMPPHDRERPAAGVMMLPIPGAGVLTKVEGQADALRVDGIDGLTITIPPGEKLVPLPDGDRYLGFMFARGPSPHAVESSLREAHSRLKVVIDA